MRPARDEMFMEVAQLVATRGTCLRAQVGAVIVIESRIQSMGYNGAPPGQPHCLDVGCRGGKFEIGPNGGEIAYPNGCTRATHAELNAIAFAARQGTPCDEGTMYCTHAMCINCARAVVAAGIRRVMYRIPYRLTEGIELLDKCNVEVTQYGGS